MYFRYFEPDPPPRTLREAENQLQEATWASWMGRNEEAREYLIQIAEFCSERTLRGETFQIPPKAIEARSHSSDPDTGTNQESADVDQPK